MKKQISIAEKHYHGWNKLFKSNEKEEEPVTIKKEKNKNVRKYSGLSFSTKYHKLLSFYHRSNEFRDLIPQTVKTKIKIKWMCQKMVQFYIIHC